MVRSHSLWLLLVLAGCTHRGREDSVKLAQYMAQGEVLYVKHCSNCHQKNGEGLAALYPPLARSDYLRDSLSAVICLIRNGISGELTVNGRTFNQPMPGVPTLTDLEVAEIVTYIGNSWGNETGLTPVKRVSDVAEGCRR
jgi:mono/diheme cytochrome c family protein